MDVKSSTGIDVLIVGAGLAGLFFAIECHRQGHSARVLESRSGLDGLGDFVGIGTSATKQFEKWPGMSETYSKLVYRPSLTMLTHDGILIGGPFELTETSHYRPVPVGRPKLIKALYEYAVSLGIPIIFGKRVTDYHDTNSAERPYVVTSGGELFDADIVVAADGVGSKVTKSIGGNDAKAMSSGWSVYRVTYPTEILRKDNFLARQYHFLEGDLDYCQVFLSAKGQMIILVSRELVTWLFTHKDDGQATETWSMHLNATDALETFKETGLEWDDRVLAIVKQTPPHSVVDFKISWRDPDAVWSSDLGRLIKIGDAAHAFIPNSTNGATQAMEDGISLAACLRLAGKRNIRVATKVHSKLRFERTSCAQKHGFKNREKWEQDFESIKKAPFAAVKSVGRWLYDHDAEQYVYDNWNDCASHVSEGTSFENTNIPTGYKYSPWTMDELMKTSENGQTAVEPGDWD